MSRSYLSAVASAAADAICVCGADQGSGDREERMTHWGPGLGRSKIDAPSTSKLMRLFMPEGAPDVWVLMRRGC